MSTHTVQYPEMRDCDEDIARNAAMFFEADRLDFTAYQILDREGEASETWQLFTEAKKLADDQRTAAYQEWMRIKRQ